jgi:hypothetical protein
MNLHNRLHKIILVENINKLKINRTSKFKTCIYNDRLNYFLKQNPMILNKVNYNYINYINIFLNTFDKKTNIDLNLFHTNLKTLSIKEKNNFNRLIIFSTNTMGAYKLKKNKIVLLKNNYNFYIFHELLHCASFKKEQNNYTTGFFKQFRYSSIGRALNEGYTSLLEARYFSENFNKNSYNNIRFIVEKIEILIGKEVMEKFYFTANLNALINEFIKYGKTKQEIIFFIDELDYIKYNLGNPESKFFCQDALYDITNFLIECYRKKCIIENKDNHNLNTFINIFQTQIISNKISYNFLANDFAIHQTNKINKYYIEDVYNYKKYYKK